MSADSRPTPFSVLSSGAHWWGKRERSGRWKRPDWSGSPLLAWPPELAPPVSGPLRRMPGCRAAARPAPPPPLGRLSNRGPAREGVGVSQPALGETLSVTAERRDRPGLPAAGQLGPRHRPFSSQRPAATCRVHALKLECKKKKETQMQTQPRGGGGRRGYRAPPVTVALDCWPPAEPTLKFCDSLPAMLCPTWDISGDKPQDTGLLA